MAEIFVDGVTKIFHRKDPEKDTGFTGLLRQSQEVLALDDLALRIKDGETVSVVGPSGCGKTTLLRVIAGLIQPDKGTVYYDGVDMKDVPPKDRGIGIVFQDYALYPHMTSKGNLAFFFQMRHREDEANERVRITSEILGVGFDQLLGRKPGTLSGGQQQRVAIGRCIVRDPTLFLFDEPLSNLDAKLRSKTRTEIKRLLHRFKITSIYITHDQIEAIILGDRIAVMREGKIDQIGTYWEIYNSPINAFVASFIGQPGMNFFEGCIRDASFEGDGFAFSLPKILEGVKEGQPVLLGIRPEHFALNASPKAYLEAKVEVVQHLVSERVLLINGQVGNAPCVLKISETNPAGVGDVLPLWVEEGNIHLFDKESGKRLS